MLCMHPPDPIYVSEFSSVIISFRTLSPISFALPCTTLAKYIKQSLQITSFLPVRPSGLCLFTLFIFEFQVHTTMPYTFM